jgi:hypothetical protein
MISTNKLVMGLAKYAPSIDPKIVLSSKSFSSHLRIEANILIAGATSIQQTISKAALPGVTLAYNNALTHAFLVAAIMAAFTFVGSAAIEWKSVKGKKVEMGAA